MATSRTLLGGEDGDDQNLLSVVRGIGRCSSDGLYLGVLLCSLGRACFTQRLASASGLQSPPSKAAASEAPAGDKDGDEQHGRCCRPANPPQTRRQW